MNEFALIDRLVDALGARRGALEGVGDDASILDVPPGQQLVVSTDTLVEGVHFEAGLDASDIGYKALAVNLSDLAAMGATPAWYFLSLTLPHMDADWVDGFASGMSELARTAGIQIAGGDTTRGPLSISVTVCGLVPKGAALLRAGARAGDLVGISGPTGLAAQALDEILSGRHPADSCLAALRRPVPRNDFGIALRGLANSCIDISDGLLADLGHIAAASGLAALIELESLPVPPALASLCEAERWDLQLGGGDDYELCFTASQEHWPAIMLAAEAARCQAIPVGRIEAGCGVRALKPGGASYQPGRVGYVHGESE